MDLVYPREGRLFTIAAIISGLLWLLLIVGTLGIALLYVALFAVLHLFARSGFIARVGGNRVRISEQQLPDLNARVQRAAERIGLVDVPETYVLRANFFDALATRFLFCNYVVLFSDVLDALESRPDAVDFYIGHEMGHIHRGHLKWAAFLAPAPLLPLLGTAYRRAEEYTCDRYGARCCESDADALLAMAAIPVGDTPGRTMNIEAFVEQRADSRGFWMSFHELTNDYPWMTKRIAAVRAFRGGYPPEQPARNAFAWLFALFVPRLGAGGGAAR